MLINELLRWALELEERGLWQESLQVYEQVLHEYPLDPAGPYYYGLSLFNQKLYDKALDIFVQCYNQTAPSGTMKEEVLKHLLTAYYEPNAKEFRANYEQNVACLSDCEHNYLGAFPDYADLPYVCIPRNDREYYVLDKGTGQIAADRVTFLGDDEYETDASSDSIFLIINIFDVKALQTIEAKTVNPGWPNGFKQPIYMLWESRILMLTSLQFVDYRPLVNKNRLVFFPGPGDIFRRYFLDHQSILPQKILGESGSNELILTKLSDILAERSRDIEEKKAFIQHMTSSYNREYYKSIFAGEQSGIRVLFFTSRFTRVVQHATRYLLKACQDQGITCELLIEKSGIHWVGSGALVEKIAQFQPNVIFRINHLKSVFPDIPDNMLFITWMQDPGPQIYSIEHAQKFNWNNFALALPGWHKVMVETGFEPARLLLQSLPYNDSEFYPRDLTSEERAFYGADVALPSNYNMPGDLLGDLISSYYKRITQEEVGTAFVRCMIMAYDNFCARSEQGVLFSSKEQCAQIIEEVASIQKLTLDREIMDEIVRRFHLEISYGIHRKTTLKWVIDGGFELKLWGRDWEKDFLFGKFSSGVLAHGEDLAKMYSATKIVLATFGHYTGHARVFEALACGALPMLRYVPEEYDLDNIRDNFRDNEDFVFYYDRQDLLDKLKYYLAHENERQRIVANGQKRVRETMSYKQVVDNMLGLVRRNLV